MPRGGEHVVLVEGDGPPALLRGQFQQLVQCSTQLCSILFFIVLFLHLRKSIISMNRENPSAKHDVNYRGSATESPHHPLNKELSLKCIQTAYASAIKSREQGRYSGALERRASWTITSTSTGYTITISSHNSTCRKVRKFSIFYDGPDASAMAGRGRGLEEEISQRWFSSHKPTYLTPNLSRKMIVFNILEL